MHWQKLSMWHYSKNSARKWPPYPPAHPSRHPPLHASTHTSLHPSIHVFIRPHVHPCVHPSMCPATYPSVCASIHSHIYPCMHPPIHPPTHSSTCPRSHAPTQPPYTLASTHPSINMHLLTHKHLSHIMFYFLNDTFPVTRLRETVSSTTNGEPGARLPRSLSEL